jgi:serine/threonine protein kinase
VIYFYDFVTTPLFQYLFLEFCPAGTLLDVVRKAGPFEGAQLHAACKAILNGLAYIHGRHIAHLDIKPSNIFIDRFGRPKLADFGISRRFADPSSVHRAGTLAFLAPEVLGCAAYDPFKADIWSLGVTFYVMAFGSDP